MHEDPSSQVVSEFVTYNSHISPCTTRYIDLGSKIAGNFFRSQFVSLELYAIFLDEDLLNLAGENSHSSWVLD